MENICFSFPARFWFSVNSENYKKQQLRVISLMLHSSINFNFNDICLAHLHEMSFAFSRHTPCSGRMQHNGVHGKVAAPDSGGIPLITRKTIL